MIVGKCEHGIIIAACDETAVTYDFLRNMVFNYSLERVDVYKFGVCLACLDRVKRNAELVSQTRQFSV
jgi:hypothetical protein